MDKKWELYTTKIRKIIDEIEKEEIENIEKAAEVLAQTIINNGLIHVFGTGHSHIPSEEAFFRAGSLACVNPMLEPSLMLHSGAVKSSVLENQSGFARAIFEHFNPQPSDVLILFSNSGVNAVPVEMAELVHRKGITLIGIGSKKYIEYLKKERKSNSIIEYCDFFIDNKGEVGDACIEVKGLEQKIAPTSTISGVLILQLLFTTAVFKVIEKGFLPPIFVSGNLPEGKERNKELINKYRKVVRML